MAAAENALAALPAAGGFGFPVTLSSVKNCEPPSSVSIALSKSRLYVPCASK
jgi:hypothetical protein